MLKTAFAGFIKAVVYKIQNGLRGGFKLFFGRVNIFARYYIAFIVVFVHLVHAFGEYLYGVLHLRVSFVCNGVKPFGLVGILIDNFGSLRVQFIDILLQNV